MMTRDKTSDEQSVTARDAIRTASTGAWYFACQLVAAHATPPSQHTRLVASFLFPGETSKTAALTLS